MDLHRVCHTAEELVDQSITNLRQEMSLLKTDDERFTVLVYFLGTMAAKYLTLKPAQKLPPPIMEALIEIEKSNWKDWS